MTEPNDRDLSDAVRRSLADQAREAPDGRDLAERIIAEVGSGVGRGAHGFPDRSWIRRAGPLLAAAVVIGLVVGVVAAIRASDSSDRKDEAARSHPPVSATTVAPTSPSSSRATSTEPTDQPSAATSTARAILPDTVKNVSIVDATFTGQSTGWALASADCLRTTGRCTALLRTTDGLRWKSHPNTPFNVPGVQDCDSPCVRGIRFATDRVGYAFGPDAFFVTTDGAQSWQEQRGGADAVETLDGNVIRVDRGDSIAVSVADVGSRNWRDVRLPGRTSGVDTVTLSRTGSAAYLLATRDGGASTVWSSADDGAAWTNRGEPCVQRAGGADATLLTTAADGSLALVCAERSGGGGHFVTVSSDGARSFRAAPSSLGAAPVRAFGAASADTVVVSSDDAYRSTDGGRTFRRLAANGGSSPGAARFIGFSSATVAHAIASNTIAVSTDAGRTWRHSTFD